VPNPKPISELAESTRKQEISRFKAVHELIMRLLLAGHTQKHISEVTGLSNSRLSRIINSPLFQLAYIGYKDRIMKKTSDNVAADPVRNSVTEAQVKAINKIIELMDDEQTSRNTQLLAAKHILDLGGHNVKQEINLTTGVQVTLKEKTYDDDDDKTKGDEIDADREA